MPVDEAARWFGEAEYILRAQSGQDAHASKQLSPEQAKLNAQLGFDAEGKFVGLKK